MVTRLFTESILPAKDEEFVTDVLPTLTILAASEELFVVIELCNESIRVAAEELFVDTVPDNKIIPELKDAEEL